jgi:hypothetical protein
MQPKNEVWPSFAMKAFRVYYARFNQRDRWWLECVDALSDNQRAYTTNTTAQAPHNAVA